MHSLTFLSLEAWDLNDNAYNQKACDELQPLPWIITFVAIMGALYGSGSSLKDLITNLVDRPYK